MCVPVTTTVLLHRPVLSYPYRRPLCPSLPFAASPGRVLCLYRAFLLSFPALSREPPSLASCLQQPYKPWSSAGASSFTRAMYPDVSEGRNFASVCVNRSSLTRSLFSRHPPLLCFSPFLFLFLPRYLAVSCSPRSPLSFSFTRLRSCKVSRECVHGAHVCANRVHARTNTHTDGTCVRTRTHTDEGKIRSVGTSDGYVSERYLK